MSEKFEMVAKTFQGLEGVLADELRALGAEGVTEGRRMVAFEGDKEMLYRANFCLRTALRILKPFFKFHATNPDELYEQVKGYDWNRILTVKTTFAIDVTAFGEEFSHSRFVTYRVKDAIVDFFTETQGSRPSIRVTNPDIRLDVHISGDEVTLSLDSSGDPLFKRGWRVAQTDAPINEVLAAGIIKLSGWDGQCDLVDPMCGSGTFVIEAALIALNINPGVFRKQYAFQNWADYDAELFSEIYNDDSMERDFEHKIYGCDIAHQAIAISQANAKNAGVSRVIEFAQRDIAQWTHAPQDGMLITNPPYGERLKVADMEALYGTLGNRLKNVFKGYHAWIIGYSRDHFDMIGLKPSVRYPLLNGSLECELREYVIFDGSYNEMRERGDNIKNDDFRASERNPHRREFSEMRADGRGTAGDRHERKRDDRRREYRAGDEHRPAAPHRNHDNYTVRDKGPSLGADKEVPIVHGRRKSWKRRDLDD